MEKWLTLMLGQEKYKISLEPLVVQKKNDDQKAKKEGLPWRSSG